MVVSPTQRNLTSTVVTVRTDTNIAYCGTRVNDCHSVGDTINNFVLTGELSTQINDLGTNCSSNSYDNRTQISVSL